MANKETNEAVHESLACFSVVELPTLTTVLMAVRAAIELKVFDTIAPEGSEAQLSATQISERINKSNPKVAAEKLDRILALLSAYGFLINTALKRSRDGARCDRTYSLSKMSLCLRRKTIEDTPMAAHLFSIFGRGSSEIYDVLKDDFQFTKAKAMITGKFKDPDSTKKFNEAMENFTKLLLDGVFNEYKGFKDAKGLMAVAGGNGTVLKHIKSRYPNAIDFDHRRLIDSAPEIKGVKREKGDVFQSLQGAETILLKSVLHNHNDEDCKKLLKNCFHALPVNGKIIILGFIVPATIENTPEARMVTSLDVQGLTDFGTKERTLAEYEALAKSAGFPRPEKDPVRTVHWFYVMEFFKKSG
ncbi:hypothetical protein SLE2022_320020 [Rubroshorea leprosula]